MDKRTLARPYAKAVFLHALAQNKLDAWQNFLQLASFLLQQKEAQDYLYYPNIEKNKKTAFVLNVYQSIAKQKPEESYTRFIQLLIENKKLPILAEIAHLYRYHYLNHRCQMEVTVRTPHDLDETTKSSICALLATRYQKNITIHTVEDTALIAGLVIETDVEYIDASLKGAVETMLERIQC